MNKQLVELAKVSPKSYAKIILKRNQILLKKLMLLKPYIGKPILSIPDNILSKLMDETKIGCPHCGDCSFCKWTEVFNINNEGCFHPKFNIPHKKGVSYKQITQQRLKITYYIDSEYIDIVCYRNDIVLSRQEWDNCYIFLIGHILWAKLPCWGENYKDKFTSEK